MHGKVEKQITMLSSLIPDQLVPQDHPIRHTKPIVDNILNELSPTFNRMYAEMGRPSIPPEHLLKSCLLIALYSIRSERQFCERLHLFVLAYNLGNFLRRLGLHKAIKDWSRSLQVKLIKMGGRIVRHARQIVFQLAELAVPVDLFAAT